MNSIEFDSCRRAIIVNGQSHAMTEKVWQVLAMLRAKQGRLVTRAQIIDEVWDGNFLTGDKGLNQAIWTLRSVLDDDRHAPMFIRTQPRKGYQWIAPVRLESTNPKSNFWSSRPPLIFAASLAVCATVLVGLPLLDHDATAVADERVATKAWLVDRDIHVELASGCLGIVKNANYADISTPVLSADGRSLAVTVREDQQCRMLTINVATGEARRFADCPLKQI